MLEAWGKMNNKEAIAKHESGEITTEQLIKELELNLALTLEGTDRSLHVPDGKHPFYRDNNKSRDHIAYSYLLTKQGKFFQNVWKKIVLKTINFLHSSLMKKYDNQIYVYEDPFMIEIDIFMTEYINSNFQDGGNGKYYKIPFMLKVKDIPFGISKEDIYYRARLKKCINEFVQKYPNGFELTDAEIRNLEMW